MHPDSCSFLNTMGRFEEIRTKVLKEFLTLDDDEINILSAKGLRTIKHLRNLKMSTIDQWKYNKEISEGSYIVLRSYIMWERTARPSPADLEAMTPDEFMAIDDHQTSFEYQQDYQYLDQERLTHENAKPAPTPHFTFPVSTTQRNHPYDNQPYENRSIPRSFHATDSARTLGNDDPSTRSSSERNSSPLADSNSSPDIVTSPTTSKVPSPSETPSLLNESSSSDSETESETPPTSEEPSPSKEPSPSESETSPPSDAPSLSESETSSPSDVPSLHENSQDNNTQAQINSVVADTPRQTSLANDSITPNSQKKLSLNSRVEELEACIFDDGETRNGTIMSRIKQMEEFIFDSSYAPPKNLTSRVNALVQEFGLDL